MSRPHSTYGGPMPSLQLPEHYLYRPLFFAAGSAPSGASPTRFRSTPTRTPSHTMMPTSTYLSRPLHFACTTPPHHGLREAPRRSSPQQHSSVINISLSPQSHPRVSPSYTPPRSSTPTKSSVLRRVHTVAMERLEAERFHREEDELSDHQPSFGYVQEGRSSPSQLRSTRAARLRVESVRQRRHEAQAMEQSIFYRPHRRGPTSPMTSTAPHGTPVGLRPSPLPSPSSRHHPPSQPPSPAATSSSHPLARSTRAAELRQQYAIQKIEELEQLRQLAKEEAAPSSREEDLDSHHRSAVTAPMKEVAHLSNRASISVTTALSKVSTTHPLHSAAQQCRREVTSPLQSSAAVEDHWHDEAGQHQHYQSVLKTNTTQQKQQRSVERKRQEREELNTKQHTGYAEIRRKQIKQAETASRRKTLPSPEDDVRSKTSAASACSSRSHAGRVKTEFEKPVGPLSRAVQRESSSPPSVYCEMNDVVVPQRPVASGTPLRSEIATSLPMPSSSDSTPNRWSIPPVDYINESAHSTPGSLPSPPITNAVGIPSHPASTDSAAQSLSSSIEFKAEVALARLESAEALHLPQGSPEDGPGWVAVPPHDSELMYQSVKSLAVEESAPSTSPLGIPHVELPCSKVPEGISPPSATLDASIVRGSSHLPYSIPRLTADEPKVTQRSPSTPPAPYPKTPSVTRHTPPQRSLPASTRGSTRSSVELVKEAKPVSSPSISLPSRTEQLRGKSASHLSSATTHSNGSATPRPASVVSSSRASSPAPLKGEGRELPTTVPITSPLVPCRSPPAAVRILADEGDAMRQAELLRRLRAAASSVPHISMVAAAEPSTPWRGCSALTSVAAVPSTVFLDSVESFHSTSALEAPTPLRSVPSSNRSVSGSHVSYNVTAVSSVTVGAARRYRTFSRDIDRQLYRRYFSKWMAVLYYRQKPPTSAWSEAVETPIPPSPSFVAVSSAIVVGGADVRSLSKGSAISVPLPLWGLPVPPTNRTHIEAAWAAAARQMTTETCHSATDEANRVLASFGSQWRTRGVCTQGSSSSAVEAPPYTPSMAGPVWKEALDSVEVPHLQESRAPVQRSTGRTATAPPVEALSTAGHRYKSTFPTSTVASKSPTPAKLPVKEGDASLLSGVAAAPPSLLHCGSTAEFSSSDKIATLSPSGAPPEKGCEAVKKQLLNGEMPQKVDVIGSQRQARQGRLVTPNAEVKGSPTARSPPSALKRGVTERPSTPRWIRWSRDRGEPQQVAAAPEKTTADVAAVPCQTSTINGQRTPMHRCPISALTTLESCSHAALNLTSPKLHSPHATSAAKLRLTPLSPSIALTDAERSPLERSRPCASPGGSEGVGDGGEGPISHAPTPLHRSIPPAPSQSPPSPARCHVSVVSPATVEVPQSAKFSRSDSTRPPLACALSSPPSFTSTVEGRYDTLVIFAAPLANEEASTAVDSVTETVHLPTSVATTAASPLLQHEGGASSSSCVGGGNLGANADYPLPSIVGDIEVPVSGLDEEAPLAHRLFSEASSSYQSASWTGRSRSHSKTYDLQKTDQPAVDERWMLHADGTTSLLVADVEAAPCTELTLLPVMVENSVTGVPAVVSWRSSPQEVRNEDGGSPHRPLSPIPSIATAHTQSSRQDHASWSGGSPFEDRQLGNSPHLSGCEEVEKAMADLDKDEDGATPSVPLHHVQYIHIDL